MWAATFSNGGVNEKDVIIMTQIRQINDLKKSVKVDEKRLQLVIGFTCLLLYYCIIHTIIVCNLLKSNLFCTIVK